MECGRIQGLPKFFEYPYYLRNVRTYCWKKSVTVVVNYRFTSLHVVVIHH